MGQYARMMAAGSVLAVLFFVLSLSVGRFYVPFDQVAAILASNFIELPITWDASMYNVVMVIRLPRVLGDILVGVALAVSGAAYQGVFRNDLVSPDLLGVSQGASVGACLAILAHLTLGGTAAEIIDEAGMSALYGLPVHIGQIGTRTVCVGGAIA